MGAPHEEQRMQPRDWLVISLLWSATLFVTLLVWRLSTFVQLTQKEIRQESIESDAAPESPRSTPGRHCAPIRLLFKLDVLTVVNVTAASIWLTLVLDCISWTYIVIVKVWDWFVIIVDGFSVGIGGLSAALLLAFFMERAYISFQSTSYQYSARFYNAMGALILVVATLGILMGAFTGGLQWKLVSLSTIVFVVVYALTCSVLICMMFSPLRKLAFELRNEEVLHIAIRITFLSVLSLVSTSIMYLVMAVAYNKCDECTLTYGYYCFTSIDAVLNVLCLTWSLKHGRDEYFKVCGCVHSLLFKKLNTTKTVRGLDKSLETEAADVL